MKTLQLILLFFLLTSCATQEKTIEVDAKNISLALNTEKINYQSSRWVDVDITIKNNANTDITILNPMTEYGHQLNFFKVKYACKNNTITDAPYPPIIKKTKLDIITIKANSSLDVKLKGSLYNVICNDPNIPPLQVIYDSKRELPEWFIKKIGTEQMKLKNKLTKLTIKSADN